MQRAVVIACTGAILSASVPGDAHWGDLVFPIYEIPTVDLPDVHDGTLEDWEDIVPGASVTDADFASSVDLDDVIYRSAPWLN